MNVTRTSRRSVPKKKKKKPDAGLNVVLPGVRVPSRQLSMLRFAVRAPAFQQLVTAHNRGRALRLAE